MGHFGLWGHLPVVGDWNGDSIDDFGVVAGGTEWHLDLANDGDYTEKILRYGLPSDQFLAGNWGLYGGPSTKGVR